ncbi:MAG: cell division protein FtsZ [Paludibacteraceae bacterium]|nr:cell division protein FtsZ [Paludibacteraceae bacterium]
MNDEKTFEQVQFDLPVQNKSIIKVIGVGGGGGNAVNNMYGKIEGVSYMLINTDEVDLNHSDVPEKIVLGSGIGAGNDPTKAMALAEEDADKIREGLTDGTRMVFITASMGGGTGTGASPIVARIAHEMGILTVAIVTIPFKFEGSQKIRKALRYIQRLSENVDALLVINNEKLFDIYTNMQLSEAFRMADETLLNATRSIVEIITIHGYVNTDFADVYNTLKDGNVAIMNMGYASGERRVIDAIEDALSSPLVNTANIKSARKILVHFYSSTEHQLRIDELDQLREFTQDIVDEMDLIWGATLDDSLGDQLKITLIATGFNLSDIPGMSNIFPRQTQAQAEAPSLETPATATPVQPAAANLSARHAPTSHVQTATPSTPSPETAEDTETSIDMAFDELYKTPQKVKEEEIISIDIEEDDDILQTPTFMRNRGIGNN